MAAYLSRSPQVAPTFALCAAMGDYDFHATLRRFQAVCLLGICLFAVGSVGASLEWWRSTIVYQIYPRSFKDSDGDGVGDLQGIISKLDHFTNIGVDSFWLSPVYRSPMKDFGYDISDFRDIDPIFGTLMDFDQLVEEAHSRGINVIMDFVPGHTSTEHEWFKRSVNRDGKYTNYYIWHDGITLLNGTRAAPNNWLSVFGGSAWAWHPVRQQYYYHAFSSEQGGLNYRDANVQAEMKDVLRFWLDKGVDGFRVDAIEKLYESEDVSLDEPVSGLNVTPFQYEYLNHTHTSNLPETIPTVSSWHDVLNEYSEKDGKDRFMVIELYGPPALRNTLYATGGNPFNFDLIDLTPNVTGHSLAETVQREYDTLPSGKSPNFVLGNHDRRRVSHKFGPQYVDLYNMLLLTLWGTPTTYYGEEIGMLEGIISWNQTIDPWGRNYGEEHFEEFSRDPERTPMQWTDGPQAGFTEGNETWLPLGQDHENINVETETNSPKQTSLKLYKQLAHLRKKAAFLTGAFQAAYVDDNVFSYIRDGGLEKYLVALNVGKQKAVVDFTPHFPSEVTVTTIAVTPGAESAAGKSSLSLEKVSLGPGDGLVLQIIPGVIVG